MILFLNYRNIGASDFKLDIKRNKDGRIFLEIVIYILVVGGDFDLEIGGNEESMLPSEKLVEMGAILRAPVDVKGTTGNEEPSMLLYSKARRCNGAGKLEASKVLAAAANGTSPADEGEILSSFRGKTVDFPPTRNYFLAFATHPRFHIL